MHFTRPRDLLVAGLVALALVYLLFQFAYDSIPRLPTFAGVTLLVLAVVEAVLAYVLRSRIRSGRVIQPVAVARAVALAKASSILGALMVGAWLAAFAYVVPRGAELTAAAEDLPSSIVGVLCGAALIAAAMWLEYCCRTPSDGDQDRPPGATG
ncbi:DUF3180 domain-containing protein [Amycolatopsis suaedae]|uniref:DUF3180 domain-containing protein n=1 Tax=Amycolatopsis suaedae TaxID=2510978 RepID=A0A4Q7J6L5_9PSEU|nr:DUF3180 domain-containing protein [Amycolatopsis suaedae]RZQ61644.1 DUF3180 domain-containing protein [Amycolatopsis suaedae]